MLKPIDNVPTIYHASLEANLREAKRALRNHMGCRLHRESGTYDDIISIVRGSDIIERHIFHIGRGYILRSGRLIPHIENFALYQ